MKKIIAIALLVLLVTSSLLLLNVDFFNTTLFKIKHIVIYITIAYIIILISLGAHNEVKKIATDKPIRLNLARAFILGVVVFTLIVVGRTQVRVIDEVETPDLYGCSYYDKYNHLVYASQFHGNCPELENYEYTQTETGEILRFTVFEEDSMEGVHDYSNVEGNTVTTIENARFYGYATQETLIEIEYIDKGIIKEVFLESVFYEEKSLNDVFSYHQAGFQRRIQNEYSELEVISDTYTKMYELSGTKEEVQNQSFDDVKEERITYKSVRTPKETNTSYDYDYYLDISKITYDEVYRPIEHVFARGEGEVIVENNSNPDVVELDFYDKDGRVMDLNLRYSFNYRYVDIYKDFGYPSSFYTLFDISKQRMGTYSFRGASNESIYLDSYTSLIINLNYLKEVELDRYNYGDEYYYFENDNSYMLLELPSFDPEITEGDRKALHYYKNEILDFEVIRANIEQDDSTELFYFHYYPSYFGTMDFMNHFHYSVPNLFDYSHMFSDYTSIERTPLYQENILIEGFQFDESE